MINWSDLIGDTEYEQIQIVTYESDSHVEYATYCYPKLDVVFSFVFLLLFTHWFIKGLFQLIKSFK